MIDVSNSISHINIVQTGKRAAWGFVLLFLSSTAIISQPLFYSQSLQKLYYSLPSSCRPVNPCADTVVLCNGILQGITVPVIYSVDSYGVLEHIGYRFLPDNFDMRSVHLAVIRFLERETLSLLATDNLNQKLANNRRNGLMLLHNGSTPQQNFYRNRNDLPDLLQRVESMDIRYEDGTRYQVILNCGQSQTLTFLFVADAELLSNMDKKERDEQLAAQLSQHQTKAVITQSHVSVCDNASLQFFQDSVYLCPGKQYVIPQMNSNLYYLKMRDTFEIVFNSRWPVATLQNVMLAATGHNYTVRVAHRQYGWEIKRYEMKIRDFFDYFANGYDRYFGIETLERDILSGTLILADRAAGNIHLAHVSINLWDLLNGGVMEMILDSNIPQHNIETLYGTMKERDDDNEKYKIK